VEGLGWLGRWVAQAARLDPQGGRERFEDGGLHGEISASGVERSHNLAVAKAVICLFLSGVFSSVICCMSSGWLHNQLETNSKDWKVRLNEKFRSRSGSYWRVHEKIIFCIYWAQRLEEISARTKPYNCNLDLASPIYEPPRRRRRRDPPFPPRASPSLRRPHRRFERNRRSLS
jgi:hypothetical protein